jgi:hypothetical protein
MKMSTAPNTRLYDTEAEAAERAVIVGGAVHRAAGYWTAAVHALLCHLQTTRFAAHAPRVLGFADDGREMLGYIPGDSGPDAWVQIVPERGLRGYAKFIRAYHDAVASYLPPPDAVWALEARPPGPNEIICHGDLGPWNVVWHESEPVGLIDWDDAGPAPPMTDIACALEHAVPFRDDAECVKWRRYPAPPDRRRRIEAFAEAYGLQTTRGLVDEVIAAQYGDLNRVRRLAERGVPRPARWVARGFLDELQSRIDWSERHRHLFE